MQRIVIEEQQNLGPSVVLGVSARRRVVLGRVSGRATIRRGRSLRVISSSRRSRARGVRGHGGTHRSWRSSVSCSSRRWIRHRMLLWRIRSIRRWPVCWRRRCLCGVHWSWWRAVHGRAVHGRWRRAVDGCWWRTVHWSWWRTIHRHWWSAVPVRAPLWLAGFLHTFQKRFRDCAVE